MWIKGNLGGENTENMAKPSPYPRVSSIFAACKVSAETYCKYWGGGCCFRTGDWSEGSDSGGICGNHAQNVSGWVGLSSLANYISVSV